MQSLRRATTLAKSARNLSRYGGPLRISSRNVSLAAVAAQTSKPPASQSQGRRILPVNIFVIPSSDKTLMKKYSVPYRGPCAKAFLEASPCYRVGWYVWSSFLHPACIDRTCLGTLTVMLDKRVLKTPGGQPISLPSSKRALAAVVAQEWESQEKVTKHYALPAVNNSSYFIVIQN